MKRKRLPSGTYYTPRDGGMYVHWDGTPEGPLSVTYDRDTAYGETHGSRYGGRKWLQTPLRGADGSCRRANVIRLAANYAIRLT